MKLSIIIPVYNKEKYLSRCYDSILNQIDIKTEDYEIIVVDDGSTDSSLSITESYSTKYSIFKILKQQNYGVSVARNHAIDIALGKYLLFLDADDELIYGSLPKVFNYLSSSSDVDMLVTNQTINNINSENKLQIRGLREGIIYSGLDAYRNGYVRTSAGGGICRTEFIRQNNIQFPKGVSNSEDTIFFGLVQTFAQSISYFNIDLYRIYETVGSASRVDLDILSKRYISAVNTVIDIRNKLDCSEVQKGIFEFYVFQIISNLIGYYAMSKEFSLSKLCTDINFSNVLPINTRYMYLMKYKANILNFSHRLYYFLSKVKNLY